MLEINLNINKKGKRNIIHILLVVFFLVELINVTDYFLKSSETITLYAKASKNDSVDAPDELQDGELVDANVIGTAKPIPSPEAPSEVGESNPVEKEIKRVFKGESKIALAVQKAELNPENPEYPAKVTATPRECSIGIFQINLADRYCKGRHVHASKVKGNTMEEKIKALQDPMYNIEVAKVILDESGWSAWSAYKNGSYLKFLEN